MGIDEYIFKFAQWVEQNYGITGLLVCLFIYTAVLVSIYLLLNLLPESKEVIVWSQCSSCAYRRKKDNVFVLACPKHRERRWNDFNMKICPQNNFCDCQVDKSLRNPTVFSREDAPDNKKR